MDKKVMVTFQCKESELKSLDNIAKGLDLSRSETIRILAFMQLSPDNAKWFLPFCKKKGVAPWQYLNVILRTFKERALQADADKNLIFEGS